MGQPGAAVGDQVRRVQQLLADLHDLRQPAVPGAVQQLRAVAVAVRVFGDRHAVRLPARQEPPRRPLLPERLLLPGGAVSRRRRVHVEERDVLPRPGTAEHDLARRPDRLRRRPDEDLRDRPAVARLPARVVAQLRRLADRPGVAAHRLRDGALPRRLEGRRQLASGGGPDRRLQRVAVVPPGHLPVAEADQRDRRRDHGHRSAAGLRHRRRPQQPPGHRGDGHVGDDESRR